MGSGGGQAEAAAVLVELLGLLAVLLVEELSELESLGELESFVDFESFDELEPDEVVDGSLLLESEEVPSDSERWDFEAEPWSFL